MRAGNAGILGNRGNVVSVSCRFHIAGNARNAGDAAAPCALLRAPMFSLRLPVSIDPQRRPLDASTRFSRHWRDLTQFTPLHQLPLVSGTEESS